MVVPVTTADHVVDHKWSVLIMIWTMDIYISKNTKFNAEFNDSGDQMLRYKCKNYTVRVKTYTEIYALSSITIDNRSQPYTMSALSQND